VERGCGLLTIRGMRALASVVWAKKRRPFYKRVVTHDDFPVFIGDNFGKYPLRAFYGNLENSGTIG
jgi:hypothetical protein